MITIDITMPIMIANIMILMIALNAVLYSPVRRILKERKEKLAGLATDVENYEKNAQLRVEEYDNKLNEARRKAKAEFDSARASAQAAGGAKVAEIKAEADAAKAEQIATVEAEFTGAQKELKGQIDTFAGEMAGKILGRAV
ncbi:MAG: ATP synthase F0 subunit B [Thermodesulfobacteriota bacterium]